MLKHANRTDVIWGYAAQLLNVGAGVVLLPFSLRYLNSEELGLWYVFIALAGLAQLLEFGFQPTIARQTAYVYSGAQALTATGLPAGTTGSMNLRLLADLVAASRSVYRLVAVGAGCILFGAASIYLYTLSTATLTPSAVLFPWLVYATGAVLNLYYGYFNGLLQGRGEQTLANRMMAASRSVMLALSIPLLAMGYGLMGLAIGSLGSAIVNRMLINKAFFTPEKAETAFIRNNPGNARTLYLTLWNSAWRMGIVQLGAFLILRANLFIATSYVGLAAAASYGLSLQLLTLLSTMSTLLFTLQMPKMNALQANGDNESLRSLFSSAVMLSWAIYILGTLLLIFVGVPLLGYLHSNTTLLALPWLLLLSVILLLEMNHALSAMYITTLNHVPFVPAAVFSGLGIVILGTLFVTYSRFGIGGLLMAQGIVQLSYNNWKWPSVALAHLRLTPISFYKYGRIGLARIFGNA
jgi:O-antigen/teichoic acid export membrane protein